MLGRLRNILMPLSTKLGIMLSKLGITPNELTALGVITALLTVLTGYLSIKWLIPVLIALSSLLDWLDGAVARATLRTSRLGSFIDSFCDRVSDTAYLISLNYLGINIYLILTAIPISLLVSYVRCRAESLGISLEGVGYLERGERVILLLVISIIALLINVTIAEYLLIAVVILSTLTIIQRLAYVIKVLK